MVITGGREQVAMAEDQIAKILVTSIYIKLKLKAHELLPVLGKGGRKIAQGIVREFLDTGRVIEVTERQARILMGRGGWKIREIQDYTGTDIATLHKKTNNDGQKFIIYGLEKSKEKALEIISSMFEEIGV